MMTRADPSKTVTAENAPVSILVKYATASGQASVISRRPTTGTARWRANCSGSSGTVGPRASSVRICSAIASASVLKPRRSVAFTSPLPQPLVGGFDQLVERDRTLFAQIGIAAEVGGDHGQRGRR